MTLHVKRLTDTAMTPVRSDDRSAGFELFSDENITIYPHGEQYSVSTGIAVLIDPGKYGSIREKRSLAAKGIGVCGGVINSGDTREIKVLIINRGERAFGVTRGQPIAQLILQPYYSDTIIEVGEF